MEEPVLRIVALIPHPKTARASLQIADAAAYIDSEAVITALHVCVDPPKMVGSTEEVDIQELRVRDEGTAVERRDEVRRIYDNWASTRAADDGARVEWAEADGAEEESVRDHLGAADLVTIARPKSMDGGDALHAAIFDHRRLVLFTPEAVADPASRFGRSIAIFWKDDEETRSCLTKADPWLKRAEKLTVIATHRDDTGAAKRFLQALESDAALSTDILLASHADAFLQEAVACGADALLIGAYRHGQLLEAIFGGDTKTVLDKTILPVLLCH